MFDRLPEQEAGRLLELYNRLQNKMTEYLGQAIESQKGFGMEDKVVIERFKLGTPHLALRNQLTKETEGLKLLVDELLRSVRVAVVRSGMA